MVDLETKLKNFKEWITIHYLKQNDDTTKYYYSKSDKVQFYNILLISNRLELEEAREDILPLLQFGVLFNGGNILYYNEDANKLTQKKFNEVVLFNITQFICGLYLRNSSWHFGTAALLMAHYGFIPNKPRYAQTQRKYLVEKHFGVTDFEFFYPTQGVKDFFLDEYVNGRVVFPEESMFKYEPVNGEVFETAIGTILHLNCPLGVLTKSGGLQFETIQIKAAYLKEDGALRKSSLRRKESHDLKELKRVFDSLTGEE